MLEERLAEAIGHEIDAEIVRHSLIDLKPSHSPKLAHCQQPHNNPTQTFPAEFGPTDSESLSRRTPSPSPRAFYSLMAQRKIQRISYDLVKSSPTLNAFRAELLGKCKKLVQSLWHLGKQRDNGKGKKDSPDRFHAQKHLNGFNADTFSPQLSLLPLMDFVGGDGQSDDDDDEDGVGVEGEEGQHGAVVELSSFSLEHSMQELPEEEMQNIVWLICSDGMEQNVRLTNIQKLHFAFEIFLGHLHAILPIPLLFKDTVHVLARILNCSNETIWLKSAKCLSRVAHGVMRSPSLGVNDKRSFADFFRQILCFCPHIWRSFEQQSIGRIVQSFMEMLTAEISAGGGGGPSPEGFLAMLASVDPELNWLRSWLHRQSILKLMMPKLSELVHELLDQYGGDRLHRPNGGNNRPRHCPLFWAFQASILFRCLQHSPVLDFLQEIVPDPTKLRHLFCRAILHFLSLAFSPPNAVPRPKGFGMARRIVVQAFLETTTTDCGAAVLSSSELFLQPLFSMHSSDGALLVQVPSSSPPPATSFPPMFDLCLKVLLNVLLHAPSLPPLGDISLLTKVEQSLRQHMTMFLYHNDNPFSNETTVQVLNTLFEHFPIDQLRSTFSDLIRTLLIPKISKLDHSNQNHRRLIISIANLTFMHNGTTHQWRKSVGKMLNRVALRHSLICAGGISPKHPHNSWATFPSTIELCESEKHLAAIALLQFLCFQQIDEKVPEKSAQVAWHHHHQRQNNVRNVGKSHKIDSTNRGSGGSNHSVMSSVASEHSEADPSPYFSFSDDCSQKFFVEDTLCRLHCLDFLPFAPADFRPANWHFEHLNGFIFFFITQPELLSDLFQSGQFGQRFVERFISFERRKDKRDEQQLVEFIGKMDLLIINFDMLFDRIGQVRSALDNIPKSLYRKSILKRWEIVEEEEAGGGEEAMDADEESDEAGDDATSLTTERHQNNGQPHQNAPTVVSESRLSTVSLNLEETDSHFWFAVLPENDTVATRHALLRTLFSKQKTMRRPFELLEKFATKFWPQPAQNRLTVRPPQHSEWLSALADYAHGLGLTPGSRANVRKRMGALRLLPPNERIHNDWFLAAVFLSSGLSAEGTSDFCERLIEQRRRSSSPSSSSSRPSCSSSASPLSLFVDSVWPVCCSVCPFAHRHPFPELLAVRVFPRALSMIRHSSVFRPLRGFLSSCQLPSLFHLFLFYTNQAYLGILPFRAVQEYIVVAVLGGPEFQALHFCAVLAHIFHCSTRHHSLHFSSKLTSLFLRPIFLANFRFSKYAQLPTTDGQFN
uniref:Non-specific serine/threonine protein kinase n=1 Tax=Globodera pallida TaxID=36090 RepID=A0A183BWK0_GLOPA